MRSSICPPALLGLALALALPACGIPDPPADVTAADGASLGGTVDHQQVIDRILSLQEQNAFFRRAQIKAMRDWLEIPGYDLPENDFGNLIGFLGDARGTCISYASEPWSLGLQQLHAGAELGRTYVAFNAGPGDVAGSYALRVRGAGNGFVAEWTDELTDQVVHVGPAAVSAAPAAVASVARWGAITLRLRGDLWVFDYHWLFNDIVYGVEIPIPHAALAEMAQVDLPPELGIVSGTRAYRQEIRKALLGVAAKEKIYVQSDFVHAERGASFTIHAASKTLPSLQGLAAGAYVAFGIERGTSADPESVERGTSIDPDYVPPGEPYLGFYRLRVAGGTARWLDLDGLERGTAAGVVQVGAPAGAPPRAGAALGVLENRLSIAWDASGAGITVDAPLPP